MPVRRCQENHEIPCYQNPRQARGHRRHKIIPRVLARAGFVDFKFQSHPDHDEGQTHEQQGVQDRFERQQTAAIGKKRL